MITLTLALLTIHCLLLTAPSVLAFEFCDDGTQGENDIRLISINDMLKENSKEWTWEPMQEIEIETRVENKNDEDGTYIIEVIFKKGESTARIAEDSDDLEKEFSLSGKERKSISLEFKIDEDIDTEEYDIYIKFYKKNNEDEECVENSEEKITIEKIEVCENEKVDEDELEITRIRDETKDIENKWEWAPGNNIKISLDLENKDYSQRNFLVELIFLDENNEEISLADDSDDTREETNLDENEDDEINFNFNLKSEVKEEKYTLYARAYSEENENICTSLKAESKSSPAIIKIEKEERKVIVTNIEGPKNMTTSSNTKYTATITNLGSKDEDRVLAIVYNYRLNIKEKIEILDLKSGERKTVTFDISIPNNASIARHTLLFSTEYEYRESQDYYKSASDEDDDIKHHVIISQGAKQEKIIETTNEIINETTKTTDKKENETVIKNETIVTEEPENKTTIPTTIMTGNVIGTPNKSPSWIILIGLLVLAIIGIILFFRKPKAGKETKAKAPQVVRRYTAKLN